MDFSGFNASLSDLNYFVEKVLTDEQKRSIALRMLYLMISHLFVMMDFILKDIAFLEQVDREKKLSDGLKFGNLGRDGADKMISMAIQLSGNKSAKGVLSSLDDIPTDILKDFFSKNENAKNLFTWAKDFEAIAYRKELSPPDALDSTLKGAVSVFLDFLGIERKRFFETLKIA